MILNRPIYLWACFVFFILCLCAAVLFQNIFFVLLPFAATIIVAGFMYVREIWLLCIASLPFAVEYNINNQWGTDLPSEPLLILCTGIFLLLVLLKSIKIKSAYFYHPIFILLVLGFIWSVISCLFSTYFFNSAKFVLAKIWYIIPFVILPFIFLQHKNDFKKTAVVYISVVSFTVLYALYRHYAKGFLFDEVNQSVQPFYRNHVNYAAVVVCSIPILYALYNLTNKPTKKYLLALLGLFLIALFFSYSRGAWLALIIGVVAVYLLKKQLLSKAFLLSIAAIIVTVVWFSKDNRYIQYHPNYKKTIYHGEFKDHWRATFSGTDMSNAERFNRWIAGIRMLENQPLTGYGPATFYNNYKPYMVTYFKTWVSENKEKSTVHNYFLLVLIEQGWIGFLLLMALVYVMLRSLESSYKKLQDITYKVILICIAAISSMILTLNMLSDLVETDKVGSLFYLCIGIAIILSVKSKQEVTAASSRFE